MRKLISTHGKAADVEPLPNPGGLSDCHLATDRSGAALTRLELGVMRVHEAFASWVAELHKRSSGPQLSFQDIALLHCVRLRGGTPSFGEMLIFQHRHDLSSLQYGFKKLEKLGLLAKVRGPNKREAAYEVTELGIQVTDRYAEFRASILVRLCSEVVGMDKAMADAAGVLERLIGLYDQATQSLLNDMILRRESPYVSSIPAVEARNGRSHAKL